MIGTIHWNPEHLLYFWLVYKTSSYTSLIINKDNSYWTQSLVFNDNIPNQHSSPSQTLFTSLKLWLYGKQTVQHISWSQGHFTSLHHQALTTEFTYSVHFQANFVDFHLLGWTVSDIPLNTTTRLIDFAITKLKPYAHNLLFQKTF